ncbi:MAG: hypothetical protein LBH16_08795 [Treponema sp.]|jgi:hypothetical protein|nr:hypothetical protein [Treponema sp.]
MKKYFLIFIALSFTAAAFSCAEMPVNYSKSDSWLIRENKHNKRRPTLTLLGVQVDMTANRDSIERETMALAPLYFWNRRCKVIPAEENPDYAARIYIRERELRYGLKTKKSLAMEIHIWKFEDAPAAGAPVYERKLPAAACRLIFTGDKTFTSSQITGRILSKAVNIAAGKLAAHKRRTRNE